MPRYPLKLGMYAKPVILTSGPLFEFSSNIGYFKCKKKLKDYSSYSEGVEREKERERGGRQIEREEDT